jgi:ketosteroid isomerase-like protein
VAHSKTDLARQVFDAFNERDVEGGLAVLDSEVEFQAPTSELANEGQPYRGHAGMRKYYADVERVWQELEVMPSEFREVGDHLIVFGRVYGRGEGGYVQDSPAQWVFAFRKERIVGVRVFTNRSAALAAVGLSE